MGILINCGSYIYSCSYSYWNILRIAIGHSMINYIKNIKIIDDNNYDKTLKNIKCEIENSFDKNQIEKLNTIDNIILLLNVCSKYNDLLSYLNLEGIFILLNNNGIYISKDSLLIEKSINKIISYINNINYKKDINKINLIFNHSVISNNQVYIQ